jgi:ribosome-associated heat shock protein Hsp15
MRIDRWLFAVRLFKARSAAADAVGGGKIHLIGERVKPCSFR